MSPETFPLVFIFRPSSCSLISTSPGDTIPLPPDSHLIKHWELLALLPAINREWAELRVEKQPSLVTPDEVRVPISEIEMSLIQNKCPSPNDLNTKFTDGIQFYTTVPNTQSEWLKNVLYTLFHLITLFFYHTCSQCIQKIELQLLVEECDTLGWE